MKIDILSLFPEMFNNVFNESIIKRAVEDNKVSIKIHDFREFTLDPHKKVDDTPYGGGAGMVLTPQPIFDCVESLKKELNSKNIDKKSFMYTMVKDKVVNELIVRALLEDDWIFQ